MFIWRALSCYGLLILLSSSALSGVLGCSEKDGLSQSTQAMAPQQIASLPDQMPVLQPVSNDTAVSQNNANVAQALQVSFRDIAKKLGPATVYISVTSREAAATGNRRKRYRNPFDFFFGAPPSTNPRQESRSGSGVIVNGQGYIVTNEHVVDNAEEITVTLQDNQEFEAEFIGSDPLIDIAVIKIKSDKPLPNIDVADSDTVQVGDIVIAIGNPYQLRGTLTMGVVSAVGRDEPMNSDTYAAIKNYIQTDASINRGNSGGPLVNISGEVVGINTSIFSDSGGGSIGIGFAIPINTVMHAVNQLIENGSVERGYLGVFVQPVSSSLEAYWNRKGALVEEVTKESPAAKAGLKSGDLIVGVDGKAVNSPRELVRFISAYKSGTVSKIRVIRAPDFREKTLTATIGDRPQSISNDRSQQQSKKTTVSWLGMKLASIKRKDGVRTIVVIEVNQQSPANKSGIRAGEIITLIEQKPVHTLDDLKPFIENTSKSMFLLSISGRQGGSFVVLTREDEDK